CIWMWSVGSVSCNRCMIRLIVSVGGALRGERKVASKFRLVASRSWSLKAFLAFIGSSTISSSHPLPVADPVIEVANITPRRVFSYCVFRFWSFENLTRLPQQWRYIVELSTLRRKIE